MGGPTHMIFLFNVYQSRTNPYMSHKDHKNDKTLSYNIITLSYSNPKSIVKL